MIKMKKKEKDKQTVRQTDIETETVRNKLTDRQPETETDIGIIELL